MFKTALKELIPAMLTLLVMTVVTGFIYPALVTVAAQAIFPRQANGSMIKSGDTIVGSELIGQQFSDPKYFWGRLSATSVTGGSALLAYNAAQSSGSNLGPTNPALIQAVKDRIAALQTADPTNKTAVPVDLVTSCASGLDPHITPAAAEYQLKRVAKIRALPEDVVRAEIQKCTETRFLGVLGETCVNVLKLNLALDAAKSVSVQTAGK